MLNNYPISNTNSLNQRSSYFRDKAAKQQIIIRKTIYFSAQIYEPKSIYKGHINKIIEQIFGTAHNRNMQHRIVCIATFRDVYLII